MKSLIELCYNDILTFDDIYDLLLKHNIIKIIQDKKGSIALYLEFCELCKIGGKIIKLKEEIYDGLKNILYNFISFDNKEVY